MKTAVEAAPMERTPTITDRLAPSLYLVALILILVPLYDATVSTAPFRFGNVQWRFGAVGLLSNTLLTPGLGYLIVVVTAVTLRHVRAQRVLSVLAWVIAAGLLALLGMFSLDALQTRAMVTPAMHTPFIIASVTAAGKLLLWAIVFVLFGRAARAPRALRRSAEAGSPSLLIRDAQAPSTVART